MKKFNHIIFMCLLLFFFQAMYAQEILNDSSENIDNKNTPIKNTVYFELLGNGGLYSIGYDRVIYQKNDKGLSVSMALTYFPRNSNDIYEFFPNNSGYISPQINYFKGNKHKLELGLGYTLAMHYIDNLMKVEEPKFLYTHYICARVGYRYQNPKNGLFFKAGFLLLQVFSKDLFFIAPWAGFAVGKSF